MTIGTSHNVSKDASEENMTAEMLESRFLSFRIRFGRTDLISLRALCAADSDDGLFVPIIARGLTREGRISLLRDAERQLEKIIAGYIEIDELEHAREIIAYYELQTACSKKIEEIETEKARQEEIRLHEEARLKKEEERRQAEEECLMREKMEREEAAREAAKSFEEQSREDQTRNSEPQMFDDAYRVPFDWREALYRVWRFLSIAVPVVLVLAVGKFLVDNRHRLIPIVVVGFIVYAWFRRAISRFFRF
ncbi:MAG: hypothetical protein LBG12_02585 [Synergistaceae bacterium]|nr:hypothetical protein [Synergistaceae bacterium]